MESKKETPLRRAVDWLIREGKLRNDADLVDMFQLSKSTISTYISGSPGKRFKAEFEKRFNISLSKFGEVPKKEPNKKTEPIEHDEDKSVQALADANKDACHANLVLAENQRELIHLLKFNSYGSEGTFDIPFPVLGKISKVLADKYQLPSEEVLLELGKFVYEDKLGMRARGTGEDAGKRSK